MRTKGDGTLCIAIGFYVRLIPFADEDGGNLFCFSVREEEYVTYLAESITIFINSLVEEENDEDGEA